MSAFAFARREGISASRLSYWRKRLAATESSDKVGFVAVPMAGAESVAGTQPIDLECAGVTMRIRSLDVEQLAHLIVALSRRAREC
jgi:hypothetical protein